MTLLKSAVHERNLGDMIVDMISSKNLQAIDAELFIRGRKLNISLVFITQ